MRLQCGYTHDGGGGLSFVDVDRDSGLAGATGLLPNEAIVVGINECRVANTSDWYRCLEEARSHAHFGFVMRQEDVAPALAQRAFIKKYGDEIQCCEGFVETASSHLCFNFESAIATPTSAVFAANATAAAAEAAAAAAAINLRESLGIVAKNTAQIQASICVCKRGDRWSCTNFRAKRVDLSEQLLRQSSQSTSIRPTQKTAPLLRTLPMMLRSLSRTLTRRPRCRSTQIARLTSS